MSKFIDLDSIWRDKDTHPNPSDYQITSEQIKSWNNFARTVTPLPQNPNTQPLNFVVSMNIHYLTLPYDESIAGLPRVYVEFRSNEYKDIHLINAIDGKQPTARWICIPDRLQLDPVTGEPKWIHCRCSMEQVVRFNMNDTMVFRVTTRDGSVLPNLDTANPDPADPNKQILCTFDVTPYIRDGSYSDTPLIQPTNVS